MSVDNFSSTDKSTSRKKVRGIDHVTLISDTPSNTSTKRIKLELLHTDAYGHFFRNGQMKSLERGVALVT